MINLPEGPWKADFLLGYRYSVLAAWGEVCKMPAFAAKCRDKADACYARGEQVYEYLKSKEEQ